MRSLQPMGPYQTNLHANVLVWNDVLVEQNVVAMANSFPNNWYWTAAPIRI